MGAYLSTLDSPHTTGGGGRPTPQGGGASWLTRVVREAKSLKILRDFNGFAATMTCPGLKTLPWGGGGGDRGLTHIYMLCHITT